MVPFRKIIFASKLNDTGYHFSLQFAQSLCNKWLYQLPIKVAFWNATSWNQTFSFKFGKGSNQHLFFKILLADLLCLTVSIYIYTIKIPYSFWDLLDVQNYSNKEHIKHFFMVYVVFLTVLTRLVSHYSMLGNYMSFCFQFNINIVLISSILVYESNCLFGRPLFHIKLFYPLIKLDSESKEKWMRLKLFFYQKRFCGEHWPFKHGV